MRPVVLMLDQPYEKKVLAEAPSHSDFYLLLILPCRPCYELLAWKLILYILFIGASNATELQETSLAPRRTKDGHGQIVAYLWIGASISF